MRFQRPVEAKDQAWAMVVLAWGRDRSWQWEERRGRREEADQEGGEKKQLAKVGLFRSRAELRRKNNEKSFQFNGCACKFVKFINSHDLLGFESREKRATAEAYACAVVSSVSTSSIKEVISPTINKEVAILTALHPVEGHSQESWHLFADTNIIYNVGL